ncbi:Fe-S cluster assembly scaffold IscU [Candidatus Marinamargulisbacteria bacterium SCGC AG-414-C22]|nr:Fe-S cluster assembly scaffold IscU [Candidatus Marinamargulisbacteria bacterium SCGC AG-414-C22]
MNINRFVRHTVNTLQKNNTRNIFVTQNAKKSQGNNFINKIAEPPKRTIYTDEVIKRNENPKNIGRLNEKDPNVGTGLVGAPACGDVMKLQIKVDENGTIQESKFKTFGCGSAIASSDLTAELVKGKTIREANELSNKEIAQYLKLPPVKLHCSMLAEDAIKAAIKDLESKKK